MMGVARKFRSYIICWFQLGKAQKIAKKSYTTAWIASIWANRFFNIWDARASCLATIMIMHLGLCL